MPFIFEGIIISHGASYYLRKDLSAPDHHPKKSLASAKGKAHTWDPWGDGLGKPPNEDKTNEVTIRRGIYIRKNFPLFTPEDDRNQNSSWEKVRFKRIQNGCKSVTKLLVWKPWARRIPSNQTPHCRFFLLIFLRWMSSHWLCFHKLWGDILLGKTALSFVTNNQYPHFFIHARKTIRGAPMQRSHKKSSLRIRLKKSLPISQERKLGSVSYGIIKDTKLPKGRDSILPQNHQVFKHTISTLRKCSIFSNYMV